MRGHEGVIAMRRRRQKPEFVSIWVEPIGPRSKQWTDWARLGLNPSVIVEPTENIARLDLRFVVGMLVMVNGEDREKVVALHQACIDAGARRVVTHVGTVNKHGEVETTLFQVFFEPGREQHVWEPEEAAA